MNDGTSRLPAAYGTRLRPPFSMIVSGQSQSGKTTFVVKLIELWEKVCGNVPSTIYWLYGQKQPLLFNKLQQMHLRNFVFIDGFDVNMLKATLPRTNNAIVVLDDLNREAFSEPYFASLFDRVCHHNNCNVVAISQNLFDPGKYFRHAMLNATYLTLLSSARDKRSLTYLNSQIFPGESNFLTDAYHDAVELTPYGHLVIDTSAHQEPQLRVRSALFDYDQAYYLPRGTIPDSHFALVDAFTNV